MCNILRNLEFIWKPKPRKQKANCAWCFENEVNKKRTKLKSSCNILK